MRNLVIFIRRYFNFFLFLVIEICCLIWVFRKNAYQRSAFLNSTNILTSRLYQRYNDVEYYFHLRAVNDSLVTENTRLRNALPGDFDHIDSTSKTATDTVSRRRFLYLPAKVVNNSVNNATNTITIHRGSKQGITPNMGVVSTSGVVGIVRNVSDNYAVVISLLNKDTRISAKLLKTGDFGSVRWDLDHPNPEYGTLTDIPKTVKLRKGDSIVTSGYSTLFPENIMVGYVDETGSVPSSNFHTIRIRFSTNFYNLQYVYVIKNLLDTEQKKLEATTPHE